MMPIRFLKNASEIADVSWETPLPVMETLRERKMVQADPLLTATVVVDNNANRDILGYTSASDPDAPPTLSFCGQYHTLIWTGRKEGTADISYIVQARSTDLNSGGPLANGWFTVATGSITGGAGSWFRVVITATDGLYWDQYRIRVQQASGTQTLISKVVGVRR